MDVLLAWVKGFIEFLRESFDVDVVFVAAVGLVIDHDIHWEDIDVGVLDFEDGGIEVTARVAVDFDGHNLGS